MDGTELQMDVRGMYDYLMRARRDLWAALEQVPDEVLSRAVLDGKRFQCIKDLVFHVAVVEDSWLHFDIQRDTPVHKSFVEFAESEWVPIYESVPLSRLLEYWKAVEVSTLGYMAKLTDSELARGVEDSGELFRVESLLWHVMLHEVRHTAQIAVLLRSMGFAPPELDFLGYAAPLGS
jgi:uncharacterized damage-inducible protein DinB